MKNIVVVVSDPPGADVAEKLRMSVGLTLEDDNKVSVLMIDNGIYTGLGIDHELIGAKEIDKHLNMLNTLKVGVFVHADSAEKRGININDFGITKIDDGEVARLISESEITIV